MTYLDMADTTYHQEGLEKRREFGRIEIYDSNTAFKKYLCIKTTNDYGNGKTGAHIRIHKGQAKQIIKALQKYIQYAEE